MRVLSPRERKILALGGLVALLAILWLILIGPAIRGFQARADQREAMLTRYRISQQVLAAAPAWQAAAEVQTATAARFALSAASHDQATELLRQRLAGLAAQEGAALKTMQDTQTDPAASRVRVRADLQIEMSQLVDLIHRLQTEEPYATVPYLSVTADRALETSRLSVLEARIEVEADWRPAADQSR